jgi:hypothetical protein
MEVTAQVEVHYCTPPGTVLGDVLRLLRSRTWAAFMTRHIAPRLEKVSPVDSSVLERLDRQWRAAARYENAVDCAICMGAGDEQGGGVQLPCGHGFHRGCIHSWLELQSTCPICRWQFPKEFAGRFVVRQLQSTAVLPTHVRAWPRASITRAPVGGHAVRVVVSLTLEKAGGSAPMRTPRPCELTALLLDEASGEMFSGSDTRSSAALRLELDHRLGAPPRRRIPSGRFATVDENKVSSRVAPSGTDSKRRRARWQQQSAETSKRQRVHNE